jgi:NAD(P)H-dependent flavin oxidoreductase YrpB (nitropropane dioxygenase family)
VFGVNLFAPNPVPVDPTAYAAYARAISPEGERYGLDVASTPITEDDDGWADKLDLLLADPVPVVTFTFGLPDPELINRLQQAGSVVGQTVTSVREARAASERGAHLLVVQSSNAGGHWGTLTPHDPPVPTSATDLVAAVRASTALPIVGAGGVGTSTDVSAILAAGADAVAIGTLLLRSDESGTGAPYRSALADPGRRETVVTRAFSGRPARALRNRFLDSYDAIAPLGYPAVHHLTSPMRRAAMTAGDPERINLWAGTGVRHATAEPAQVIFERLAGGL